METLDDLMAFGIEKFETGQVELASLIFTETIGLFQRERIDDMLLYRSRCFLEMVSERSLRASCWSLCRNDI